MEIRFEPHYSESELTLLDMHSVLNVLNVVTYELLTMAEALDGDEEVHGLIEGVVAAARQLSDPVAAYEVVANGERLIAELEAALDALTERKALVGQPWMEEKRANLRSVYAIIRVRTREILQRRQNPDAWVAHDIQKLKTNFLHVFQAIERNSHGRYRIVSNVAQHEEGDYLVTFEVNSEEGDVISMPAVFQDVMRDLIANARKYTRPGGTIQAGLFNSGNELRFVVVDNGRGIPSDEIAEVVKFGKRGSNVTDHPTRGAGFGLTKAHWVTHRFGGRMWIFSEGVEGKGTRIELRIPCPGT